MTPFTNKGLFDTHTFLWWFSQPEKLSEPVRQFCAESENELLLSVVTIWEIQIKVQIGKFNLIVPLPEIVARQEATNNVKIIPVTAAHALALDSLPPLHKDPFDCLLIAQAQVEGATLLTTDANVTAYPIATLW